MFLDLDLKESNRPAAVDDSGGTITYGELCLFAGDFFAAAKHRCLIFILCENKIGALAGYAGAQSSGIVPLLLDAKINRDLLNRLLEIYRPEYLWAPGSIAESFGGPVKFRAHGFALVKTGYKSFPMHNLLSLLLTTSGTTGSPRVVRQSYDNIRSNASSIIEYLEITTAEKPITTLPMNYTYGLSIINSHLLAGATILMTDNNIMQKEFWDFFRKSAATSFGGVPYTYEMLLKLRFFRINLPSLKTMTQAGGKLPEYIHEKFAEYAQTTHRRFFVMYGQVEATARIAYLPAHMATKKIGSIGLAIPGGELFLVDESGRELAGKLNTGELAYRGPNVTMGYAVCAEDLAKGDENNGVLHTGDIATRDDDGYYYIIGRKKRFLKLYGLRINLDEVELMIKNEFNLDCACTGDDTKMLILITDKDKKDAVYNYIIEKTGLFFRTVDVCVRRKIARNAAGKVIYET